MTVNQDLLARLDSLEARAAHQQQSIEALSETIADQWKKIDALERKIGRLGGGRDSKTDTDAPDIVDPPPPHY